MPRPLDVCLLVLTCLPVQETLRRGVRKYFPSAGDGAILAHSACMFTNTPDNNFVIDRHPSHPQVCEGVPGASRPCLSGMQYLMPRPAPT